MEIRRITRKELEWAGNAIANAGAVAVWVTLPDEYWPCTIAIGEYPSGRACGDGHKVKPEDALTAVIREILYSVPVGYGEDPDNLLKALEMLWPNLTETARKFIENPQDRDARDILLANTNQEPAQGE